MAKEERKDKKNQSKIDFKHTSMLDQTGKKKQKREWGKEGIDRCNDLCKDVALDRQENPHVDKEWKTNNERKKKRKRAVREIPPIACNEL